VPFRGVAVQEFWQGAKLSRGPRGDESQVVEVVENPRDCRYNRLCARGQHGERWEANLDRLGTGGVKEKTWREQLR